MLYLKQSTASQAVLLGPFVDDTDGTTAETGLTIANTDIRLSANGGNMAAKNSGGGTHDENGYYTITLDATDTATVGRLQISCKVAGALAVWMECQVLEEAVYDAMFAASAPGYLQPTTAGRTLDVTATGAAGIDWGNVENPATAVDLSATDIQLADTTTTVTNQVTADVTAISGGSTAADNLQLMYDGTGYTDETAPASRAQVDGIGSGSGGSIPFDAVEDNTGGAIDPSSAAFVGTVDSGTFASTASQDGTSHTFSDSGNDIDVVYGFQVGGGRVGTTVQISANVNGNTDEIKVKAYDHVGADWEIIGTLEGSGGTAFKTLEPALFQKYTGTGSELGKVYIRFETDSTTPSLLEVDQCVVLAANLGQTIGYADGAVWLDTNASNTNTESFVDGVADNPVSTLAAALTISAAIGIKRIRIISGSSITLASTQSNCEFMGENWALALGGQTLTDCHIFGASLSGIAAGTGTIYENCIVDSAITIPPSTLRMCYLGDVTITAASAGSFFLNDCRSRVAGTGSANFDFGSGNNASGLSMRAYSGGIEIENMGAGTGTYTMSLEGNGALTINANCSATSQVALRGNFRLTDNASGAVTVIPTVPTITQVDQGVAQAGGANSITLASTASATNGQYDPGIVTIVTGTGAGQSRSIIDYVGSTKVATVDKDWRTNPDTTSSYIVTGVGNVNHVNEGLAQAGATGTITLNSSASATDDIYNGQVVFIKSGTGQDQARVITDYNGTTKVATVHKDWNTTPDTTSGYVLSPVTSQGDRIEDILADTGTDGVKLNATQPTGWAANLVASAGQIIIATVDTVTNTHTPTTTEFQADDITEATADHYNGRVVIFTSGVLAGQATDITDYAAVGGIGQFTVTALTEAPSNNDTFIIV